MHLLSRRKQSFYRLVAVMLIATPKHHDEYIQNNGAEPLEQSAKIGVSKSGRRILSGLLLASPRGIVVQVV